MAHDRGYEQAAHLYDLFDTKGDSASSPTSVHGLPGWRPVVGDRSHPPKYLVT